MLGLRRLASVLCTALAVASASEAQVTLSPVQMRELAGQAVLQGQAGLAYDLSGALLERDETDLQAHLIRSRAARDLGRNEDALFHARRAWALAKTPDGRYAAALAQAQALSSAGRRTAAQLWLRRAVQAAPTEALRSRAIADFRHVRRQNPWSTALTLSVAPSSNINNGSRNETSELFDLPFLFQLEGEARALSGVEMAAGFSTRYRLSATQTRQTELEFGASHKTYSLSDEAREIAPDAQGSDFASSHAFIGLRNLHALPDTRAQVGWDLRVGRNWYGGDALYDYARAGLSYRRHLGDLGLAQATLSRELQQGTNGREDAAIWSASFGYGLPLGNGDRLALWLGATLSESDADYLDYTLRQVGATYTLSRPVGPARLEFGINLSDKRHDRASITADGRSERSIEARITAALPEAELYGFVPTVTLRASRTDANVDLYETETLGVQIGMRSAF